MRQKRVRFWSLPSVQQAKATILTAACFGLGGLLGCLLSARIQGEGFEALMAYMDSYLSLMGEGGAAQPGWLGLSWSVFREAILLTLLRFTVLGVLLIPLAMGLKGFLLSFAISAFARSYGWRGLGAAALLFGIPEGVQVVVLFLLAVKSWVSAERRGRETKSGEGQEGLRIYVVCYLILVGSVLLQKLLVEPMARGLTLILG